VVLVELTLEANLTSHLDSSTLITGSWYSCSRQSILDECMLMACIMHGDEVVSGNEVVEYEILSTEYAGMHTRLVLGY
jgi:hypothetical protein